MWFAEAQRIYLLPIGRVPGNILFELENVISETFKKEVIAEVQFPLPLDAYDREKQQCSSTIILGKIAEMNYKGMVLAVIDIDLFVTGLNFILGEADPVNGNAIISLARLRQEFYNKNSDLQLFVNRTIKNALQAIGSLYGLRNCPDKKCLMCLSVSVEDTDNKDVLFCHLCSSNLSNQLDS